MTKFFENEIIRSVLRGNVNDFEKLVTAYEKNVYSLALRMVGDPEDAADMTQETFIKAYRSLSSFRGDSKFSSWLYRIASNVCLDFLRSRSRHPQVSLSSSDEDGRTAFELPDMSRNPEEQLMKKLSMEAVRRGLEQLPEQQRQILVLRELGGLSYAELAQTLGLEEGTVKSRIFRARKRLCALLLRDGNISGGAASVSGKGGSEK
ncbi:MAG: sigma-70 family RNA polymerase sigma factor [Oscillospiraceae bacterium]|nr:sigma-70 family RNA polymerase sigma factor [Oscillospiraceae bacterium]